MTAYHFVVTEIETGRIAGHALICPDARYCSVRWRNGGRLDRRFMDESGWSALMAEVVAPDWPKGHVETDSAIGTAVLSRDLRRRLSIQWVSSPAFQGRGHAATLDGYLGAQFIR